MPDTNASCVYWMQGSFRFQDNPALQYSLELACTQNLNLEILVVLLPSYLNLTANTSPFDFFREGLEELIQSFEEAGLSFHILEAETASPCDTILQALKALYASHLVCDRGILKDQRRWRSEVRAQISRDFPQLVYKEVDGASAFGVAELSDHQEWSARTLRSKVLKNLDRIPFDSCYFPKEIKSLLECQKSKPRMRLPQERDLDFQKQHSSKNRSFSGGESEAFNALDYFLRNKLRDYSLKRADAENDHSSRLSSWLHFGHLSPRCLIQKTLEYLETQGLFFSFTQNPRAPILRPKNLEDLFFSHDPKDPQMPQLKESAGAFFEQVLVRRELALNYCWYNRDYDSFEGIPAWAKKTLEDHRKDSRPYAYSKASFLNAQTHDPYWNACQRQLLKQGTIHNHLRMYWGKKVLEWSASPESAYEILVQLNDELALDGRDANGYTGIAWCFGTHDRPWAQRPITGSLRYMNAQGLKRKFDVDTWAKKQ